MAIMRKQSSKRTDSPGAGRSDILDTSSSLYGLV